MLGISSRQEQNIQQGLLNLNELWFANYFNANPTEENTTHVTAFFKIARRTESLDQQFIQSSLYHYQLDSVGKGTHLIEKIVYGAEFICLMRRPVDLGRETKESAEKTLLQAARSYFEGAYLTNSEPPMELDSIRCTVLSSVEAYHATECTVQQFANALTHFEKLNVPDEKCRPIDIALLYIPEQMEIRFLMDKINDKKTDIEEKYHLITTESCKLYNTPFLDHVPPLVKLVSNFRQISTLLWNEIELFYLKIIAKPSDEDKIFGQFNVIIHLLDGMSDWLKSQHSEIDVICSLLNSAQLPVLDLEEIKNKLPSGGEKFAKVFILRVDYIQDLQMEYVHNTIHPPQSFLRPKFNIISTGEQRYVDISQSLYQFANEAKLMSSANNTIYYIGLVEGSTPFNDGEITTIKYYRTSSSSTLSSGMFSGLKSTLVSITSGRTGSANPSQINGGVDSHETAMSSDDSDEDSVNSRRFYTSKMTQFFVPPPSTPLITEQVQLNWIGKSSIRSDKTGERRKPAVNSRKRAVQEPNEEVTNETKLSKPVKTRKGEVNRGGHRGHQITVGSSNTKQTLTQQNYKSQLTRRGNSLTQRIAEIFANESNGYSRLAKTSQPNLLFFNTKQRSTGPDFQWFDIGYGSQPSLRNHKTVILMGATGSGKSTLIDGMVNYILGVKLSDPFRFKCVHEDESVARNQALSQTSSVTAYTIHHHEGMTVPFSITLIDTPGYGDTRGVARDKEITQMIHRFLTQEETRIDEIHAACFVAASSNSRLTVTQRYILDSVLSIFGKDVKENIRLLVTFADNAEPPVVEACRVANFPVTFPSTGITYSKFNSSVLYASIEKGSFDELFWEMGQENFQKFFKMLEGMNGKDLTSTREVIQNRQLLEWSMKSIERELEVCLSKIENMELFRAKLSAYGRNNYNNDSFEKSEMRLVQVNCDKGFWAYNCLKCQQTCDSGVKSFANSEKTEMCRKQMCFCPDSEHEFQITEWRTTSVMTRTTLLDMKAEYESIYGKGMTNEQLQAKCLNDLNQNKTKILNLLKQVGDSTRLLESTALRSNALSPADYLSLMRSRVAEEQKPGYLTRLETLGELQQMLASSPNNVPRIVVSPITEFRTSLTKTSAASRSRSQLSPNNDDGPWKNIRPRRNDINYFSD